MKPIKSLALTILLAIVGITLLLAGCGSNENKGVQGEYTITDAQGTIVAFQKKPERIMTQTISTDNILLGLVKPERVVAVNTLLDDPISSNIVELGKQIPNKIRHPKVEEILALEPDLVIVADWGNIDYIESLRNMGINVVVVRGAKSLEDIKYNIRLIASAVGEPQRGEKLIQMMTERLEALRAKTAAIPEQEKKAVLLVSLMNNYGGIGCIYDEACQWAGVNNALADYGLKRGDKLTKEIMVQIDPDIIFMPTYTAHGSFDIQGFRDKFLKDPALQEMKAIKSGNVKMPRDSYIYTASQDFCFAAQEIAYTVYGNEFFLEDQQHLSAVED